MQSCSQQLVMQQLAFGTFENSNSQPSASSYPPTAIPISFVLPLRKKEFNIPRSIEWLEVVRGLMRFPVNVGNFRIYKTEPIGFGRRNAKIVFSEKQ